MPRDFKLSNRENFIMALYRIANRMNNNDVRFLQLDTTITTIEQVPILIDQPGHLRIKRMNTTD